MWIVSVQRSLRRVLRSMQFSKKRVSCSSASCLIMFSGPLTSVHRGGKLSVFHAVRFGVVLFFFFTLHVDLSIKGYDMFMIDVSKIMYKSV